MIELHDIQKRYQIGDRELQVLRGVSFTIEKGELVAIMGPSGSGKSTILNLLGCLDVPTSGSYILDGQEVSRLNSRELAQVRAQKIGFVFQQFNLLPKLSALANVKLGLEYAGAEDYKAAMESLTTVGLADRADHRPTELSGGEQQRVAIARALAKNPPLILADEPTGNLDSKSGDEIINMLTALHAEQGITLVMITHDPKIAGHCQRIIHIMDGMVEKDEKVQ
ncbi:MAG: ABC transporter ATP-binding protein [Dehalococcoidia bacterium]|jgi:putative ABC transport system ATP-binding protein